MAHAEGTARVAVDADTLWRAIGSFQGVGDWHPLLDRVEGEGERPGAIRTAFTAEGQQQVECLREVDAGERRYRYTMESSPLPVADYSAELRVDSDRGDTSTVRWAADFVVTTGDEADAVAMVEGFLQAGVAAVADRYGRSAP